MNLKRIIIVSLSIATTYVLLSAVPVFAEYDTSAHEVGHGSSYITFLFLAFVILIAKIGSIVEKYDIPSVLGELVMGVLLSGVAFAGIHFISEIQENEIIAFFAELGAVLLLFQIGLESNIEKIKKVGAAAGIVAVIGVTVPFILGSYVLGPVLFPDLSQAGQLFIGASLVATSVGISVSVLQYMGIGQSRIAHTILGAAVIDDILGLFVLAIVSALAVGGDVTIGFITILSLKAFGFLFGAVLLGGILASEISWLFSRVHTGVGMKLAIAFAFALIFAYIASLMGLAPIIGAFAAGLILDEVHFKSFANPAITNQLNHIKTSCPNATIPIDNLVASLKHKHVEDLIMNLSMIFTPIFFLYTGLLVDFAALLDPSVYVAAATLSVVAIGSKLISGIGAQGNAQEKLFVGLAMIPRGEVGLIFANVGRSVNVLPADAFAAIVLVIMVTTFITPPLMKMFTLQTEQQ